MVIARGLQPDPFTFKKKNKNTKETFFIILSRVAEMWKNKWGEDQ